MPAPRRLTITSLDVSALQNPEGLATFGVFRGNDRIIYWREVEN